MFVFTVRVEVEKSHAEQWYKYMTQKHVLDVLDTDYFEKAELEIVLSDNDETSRFVSRYYFIEMELYERYLTRYAPKLRAEHNELFGDKVKVERTVSELKEYCFT
jgi:ribosomal protein S17